MNDTGKREQDILEQDILARELLGRLLQKVINKDGPQGWRSLEETLIEAINATGKIKIDKVNSGVKELSPTISAATPRGRVLLLIEIARIVGV